MNEQEILARAREALRCLYIQVPEEVAKDVEVKVEAALALASWEADDEEEGWQEPAPGFCPHCKTYPYKIVVEPEAVGELHAWLVVEPGAEVKCCPRCGGLALEGEEDCKPCGLHPKDDMSWRIAGRVPLKRAPWADGEQGEAGEIDRLIPDDAPIRQGEKPKCPKHFYEMDGPCTCQPDQPTRPEIVCLCGSSRFVGEMAILAWELEKAGVIALGLHLLPSWYSKEPIPDHLAEHEGVAEQMDALHLEKIALSDRVHVVNPGGYVGESTAAEINFALGTGKPLTYEVRPVSGPGAVMINYALGGEEG